MPAAIRITAAVVIAWIALIRGAQALDGIVIVGQGTTVVAAAGTVKLRTQILCGAGNFRTALHTHAAGETSGNHYGLSATSYSLKFHNAFIHVNFSKAAAINFNVKLCSAHGNNRAGSADLECGRSAHALLNLRAHAAHQKLEILPSAGLGLLQQQLGVSAHQHIASVREFQQQAALIGAYGRIRRQNFASDRSGKSLRGKLNADFPFKVGNCCSGIRRAGGSRWRRLLGSGSTRSTALSR